MCELSDGVGTVGWVCDEAWSVEGPGGECYDDQSVYEGYDVYVPMQHYKNSQYEASI